MYFLQRLYCLSERNVVAYDMVGNHLFQIVEYDFWQLFKLLGPKTEEWPKSFFSQLNQYLIKGKCCEN